MLKVEPFSQNNPQWKRELLAEKVNMTIGNYGCTINVIAAVLRFYGYSYNPSTLNRFLIDHNGYSGALVLWKVIEQIDNNHLRFIYRWPKYDNAIAKLWLAKGCPVLAEVNAAPIGSPKTKHWIALLGDQKAVDPWPVTNNIVSTSKYPKFTGMAVYQYV